jgi:hypothetical protein
MEREAEAELLALTDLHPLLSSLTVPPAALARHGYHGSSSAGRASIADILVAAATRPLLPYQRRGATVHL